MPLLKGIYAITDCENLAFETMLEKTGQILEAGIIALQYRDKNADDKLRRVRAKLLQDACRKFAVPFIVNDDIHLADFLKADGVHIGIDDPDYAEARNILGNKAIIGVSCYNNMQSAISAQNQGADYVAFGSFYPTRTKENTVQATTDLLIQAKQEVCIPVVAIGGITPENARPLLDSGADILAVVSNVYDCDDPITAVLALKELFQKKTD